ncbi:hypothetical protein Tco_0049272, partial [Tanacetum coccineum]
MALEAEPPQKKEMTAHEWHSFVSSEEALLAVPIWKGIFPLIVLSSMNGNSTAPTTNAAYTLELLAEHPQKKPTFQMSAPKDFEVSDDDNHSTAPPVQGNAPTTNAASTLALPVEPPQKKQMTAHE